MTRDGPKSRSALEDPRRYPRRLGDLYFNYRYNDGLDPTKSVPLEIINKALCSKLKAAYPIQAISCQMQTLPVDPERPNETGSRQSAYSSIYTIGEIDSLNIDRAAVLRTPTVTVAAVAWSR